MPPETAAAPADQPAFSPPLTDTTAARTLIDPARRVKKPPRIRRPASVDHH
jgi:hypothetical protein